MKGFDVAEDLEMVDKLDIAVTGSSGFIGQYVVRQLREAGHNVTAYCRRDAGLEDTSMVQDYLHVGRHDYLVHLAECNNVREVTQNPDLYHDDAHRVLEHCLAHAARKLVYMSSALVYGDTFQTARQENEKNLSSEPYARLKLSCEKKVIDGGGVVLRLANVIGPGQSSQTVMSDVQAQLGGDGPVQIFDGKPVRDFVYVGNVVDAIEAVLGSNCSGEVFNVGSGEGISILQLCQTILELVGENRDIVETDPQSRISTLWLDHRKISDQTGWQPRTPLAEALRALMF